MDFGSLGNTCVVGLHWGDEGKGKIVDVLTEHFDVVVRYAGGANAGHTVRLGDQKFALHLIPSGILRPNVACVIGNGVVVDAAALSAEIDELIRRGVSIDARLFVSSRAHLVMPWHKKQDLLSEGALGSDRKIGTTVRGIGPCYADKMLRTTAVRVGDLLDLDRLAPRVREIAAQRNRAFAAIYHDNEPLDADRIVGELRQAVAPWRNLIVDTTPLLHQRLAEGKRFLFEGAQGSLLDVDHGTYPYVTSSSCGVGGVLAGTGLPPRSVRTVVGVMKAYCTRVGAGPFPTELNDETGETIRRRGHEYGTTTGRPRRCGWFDAVAARYAVALSGTTQIALMHLDTLGTLPEIRVCTGYRVAGKPLDMFTPDIGVLDAVEPVYETLPGWSDDLSVVTRIEQLPPAARAYLDRIEQLLGAEISLVSVGPDRRATLHRAGRGA